MVCVSQMIGFPKQFVREQGDMKINALLPMSECTRWVIIFTPRAHARARGYVIGRGLAISTKKFQNFLNLSKYSLSEVQSNTGRLLIEFNRLQYTLAAPEVFVAFANPVCLPSWYRVSIVRNTNIDRSKWHD